MLTRTPKMYDSDTEVIGVYSSEDKAKFVQTQWSWNHAYPGIEEFDLDDVGEG